LQRLFRRLHAGLHPDLIVNGILQGSVDFHHYIDGAAGFPLEAGNQSRQQRTRFSHRDEWCQLARLLCIVGERETFSGLLEEEIERILHRHFHDQIHLDIESRRRLREHQPRQIVRLWVLLPVDEMLHRPDIQAVGEDFRPAIRCRPEPHDVGAVADRALVLVARIGSSCDDAMRRGST
jgi:hypothetical protein